MCLELYFDSCLVMHEPSPRRAAERHFRETSFINGSRDTSGFRVTQGFRIVYTFEKEQPYTGRAAKAYQLHRKPHLGQLGQWLGPSGSMYPNSIYLHPKVPK